MCLADPVSARFWGVRQWRRDRRSINDRVRAIHVDLAGDGVDRPAGRTVLHSPGSVNAQRVVARAAVGAVGGKGRGCGGVEYFLGLVMERKSWICLGVELHALLLVWYCH